MYCPRLFAPADVSPGRVSTNLRMPPVSGPPRAGEADDRVGEGASAGQVTDGDDGSHVPGAWVVNGEAGYDATHNGRRDISGGEIRRRKVRVIDRDRRRSVSGASIHDGDGLDRTRSGAG